MKRGFAALKTTRESAVVIYWRKYLVLFNREMPIEQWNSSLREAVLLRLSPVRLYFNIDIMNSL
jgi:3-polyprenyl-4-hydroxybenzoate decarboxylase